MKELSEDLFPRSTRALQGNDSFLPPDTGSHPCEDYYEIDGWPVLKKHFEGRIFEADLENPNGDEGRGVSQEPTIES